MSLPHLPEVVSGFTDRGEGCCHYCRALKGQLHQDYCAWREIRAMGEVINQHKSASKEWQKQAERLMKDTREAQKAGYSAGVQMARRELATQRRLVTILTHKLYGKPPKRAPEILRNLRTCVAILRTLPNGRHLLNHPKRRVRRAAK